MPHAQGQPATGTAKLPASSTTDYARIVEASRALIEAKAAEHLLIPRGGLEATRIGLLFYADTVADRFIERGMTREERKRIQKLVEREVARVMVEVEAQWKGEATRNGGCNGW